MIKIAKITTQKKNAERFNVYIDRGNGEEYGFSVDQDVLISFPLKKGLELNEEMLAQIQKEDEIKKAYKLALHYLSYRMRTIKEVDTYLQEKEVTPEASEQVIKKLLEYRYLNDEEYAFSFVRTKMNTSNKGPAIIKRDLEQKGVRDTFIKAALNQYVVELQIQKVAELIQKHSGKRRRESAVMWKNKQTVNLLTKGFSHEVIQRAFAQTIEDSPNEDQMTALTFQAEKLMHKFRNMEQKERTWKVKQHLYRKGFPLELIDKYLSEDK